MTKPPPHRPRVRQTPRPLCSNGGLGGALWAIRALCLVGLGLLGSLAGPLAGQVTGSSIGQVVADRELEYQAALSEYTASYDAWEVLQRRWNQLLEDQAAARRRGEDDRGILAEAQELSGRMSQAENRLEDLRVAWRDAGQALVSALDAHLELLTTQAQTARGAQQSDIAVLYRDRDNRLKAVEREMGPIRDLQLRPLPEVTIDPRDGPREILFKAQLLNRKVAQHETWISDLNEEIEDLQRRQRRSRTIEDFMAGVERWDDTQVPVTAETPRSQIPDEVSMEGDSTAVVAPKSLEERILELQTFLSAVEIRRDQLKEKADLFLQRASGVSSWWA